MQNIGTNFVFRARPGRVALPALLLPALLLASASASAAASQQSQPDPRGARGSVPAKSAPPTTPPTAPPTTPPTTTNSPVDASAPAAKPDPTPGRIGTGGVVELTSLDPETPARDTVVIPTELEPGTPIPPTKRTAAAGRPLGTAAVSEAASDGGGRSLAAGSEPGGAFMDQVVPTALALGATIAAIFGARALVKRFGNGLGGGKRPSGVVEVLARYPFARGHHIVLIKVGRRVLVTHQSAQGIQTLSEFTSQAEVADIVARCESGARGTEQFSFDSLLRSSDREFDAPGTSALPAAERRSTQKATRPDARAGLPASVRNAEIETIDLTRRRGVLR
jgi:flagellar biogenesis protein FliO